MTTTEPEPLPALLDIDEPDARCTVCGFTTQLAGQWSVEDGRLVFRAAADPLPYRGPDLFGCSEGRESHTIVGALVEMGHRRLPDEEFEQLRATAEAASS